MDKFDKKAEVEILLPEPTMQDVFNEIVDILGRTPPKRYPKQLPDNAHDAANRFIKLINFRPTFYEKPYTIKSGSIWVWNFKTRILMLLDKYLNVDNLLRDTIDSAVLIGVDWRGDDFDSLLDIINEQEIMNKIGVAAYRAQSKQKLKEMNIG